MLHLATHGLAGVVSPQRFAAADEAVELDLRQGGFFRLDHDFSARERPELGELGANITACGASQDSAPTVDAMVDGTRVRLAVDTGMPLTLLCADTPLGVELSVRAASRAFAMRADEILRVGVLPRSASFCGLDGILGLDVLRGCTVVLDTSGGVLVCETPPAGFDTVPGLARALPAASRPSSGGACAESRCGRRCEPRLRIRDRERRGLVRERARRADRTRAR